MPQCEQKACWATPVSKVYTSAPSCPAATRNLPARSAGEGCPSWCRSSSCTATADPSQHARENAPGRNGSRPRVAPASSILHQRHSPSLLSRLTDDSRVDRLDYVIADGRSLFETKSSTDPVSPVLRPRQRKGPTASITPVAKASPWTR